MKRVHTHLLFLDSDMRRNWFNLGFFGVSEGLQVSVNYVINNPNTKRVIHTSI